MARSLCCRTRLRFFLTLIVLAAFFLFALNIISQIYDIPPSGFSGGNQLRSHRHEVIDSWRKEKSSQNVQQPAIPPVPCEGSKCARFMNVLGMDTKSGEVSHHYCKQPILSLANDTLSKSFSRLSPLVCSNSQSRTSEKTLYSNGELQVPPHHHCLVEAVIRPEGQDNSVVFDPFYIFSDSDHPSLNQLKGASDFYRISCAPETRVKSVPGSLSLSNKMQVLLRTGEITEQEFVSNIKPFPEGRPEQMGSDKSLPYSVLLIGVGSLSHMSFQRLLPKTYDHFTNHMKSFTLHGYNTLGDGTADSLLPILTGMDDKNQPEVRRNVEKSDVVDRLHMLWNTFDSQGYMTLYAEDNPSTNTFNDKYLGFEMSPTSHYMRPFWLATERSSLSSNFCLGAKPKHKYLLDYVLNFHKVYKSEKRFALAMLKELTNLDVNNAQYLDTDLLEFFVNMEDYLKDTVVLLMSDHGISPLQSVTDRQARLEARMPLMAIYLPDSFLSNYGEYAKNIVKNEDVLTTPYDVHKTLSDILDRKRLSQDDPRDKNKFGKSLFSSISQQRTCKEAGVDIHWCACAARYLVRENEINTNKMTDSILSELNRRTAQHRDLCTAFTEIQVISVTRLVPNEEIAKYESETNLEFNRTTQLDQNYYQLVVRAKSVSESHLYEVTFSHSSGILAAVITNYELASDIVRLDYNHSRSTCVTDRQLADSLYEMNPLVANENFINHHLIPTSYTRTVSELITSMDKQVVEGVYLGNLADSRSVDLLRLHSITHILSIHDNPLPYYRGFTYLCVSMADSGHARICHVFEDCIMFIHNARLHGGRVLVHCLAGVSRSATIVAAYLISRTNLPVDSVVQAVRVVRPLANPSYSFRQQLKEWSKSAMRMSCQAKLQLIWTAATDLTSYNDQMRCTRLLALQNSVLTGSEASSLCDSERKSTNSTGEHKSLLSETSRGETTTTTSSGNITQTTRTARNNSNSSLSKSEHKPIIMGNGKSSHIDFQHSEKEKRTKMEKMRSALRKSFSTKSNKNGGDSDKNMKPVIDTSNNNNEAISDQPHYNNGMSRSATLPAYTNGHLPSTSPTDETDRSTTLKARLLPAYKNQHPFTAHTIQYRERIASTPSYTSRPRTSSQSSSYSHKYNSRVVSTHIPDHIDKRLVRSRSVGIIPDTEIRMRQTKSASVVKLSEVEDWIV